MTAAPSLFDRPALVRNRQRARPDTLFLQKAAIDEVKDRMAMVNRDFTDPVVVTGFPDIWQPALPAARIVTDEATLDLAADSADLAVHGMCLHWAEDPVGQLIQCRRALRPDGLLLAVFLGGQTLAELRQALATAEASVTGGLSPRVSPMAEIRSLGGLLQRAGLALPVADSLTIEAEYRDLAHLMHDLRAMGETNVLLGRPRQFSRRQVFDEAARLYDRHWRRPSGRIAASFEIITLTGWAPSAAQPRPLRPGSAKARLADALKVPEIRLPD
jgi:SAM-dependent methyltransferase